MNFFDDQNKTFQLANSPLVTVVIPCYNHERYIQECIKSVIDQDYANIELIIIDDGSSDNSVDKINEMVDICRQRFVNFEFRSRLNKGLSSTLNEGLLWAKGEFFQPIASDDVLLSNKTSIQVDVFNHNKNCAAVFGGYHFINDRSELIETVNKPPKVYCFKDVFLRNAFLPAPSALIRTDSLRSINGYNPKIVIEDLYVWLKLTNNGSTLFNCGKIVVKYRSHKDNFSKRADPMWLGVEQVLSEYSSHRSFKKALANSLMRHAYEINSYDKNKVFGYLKKALGLAPSNIFSLVFIKTFMKLLFR